MNFDAEQLLKILHQPGVVQQTTSRFPLHQEIEIAVLARFASGDGAKNADITSPAPLSEAEDFLPWTRP
jgi:hypothetical protein